MKFLDSEKIKKTDNFCNNMFDYCKKENIFSDEYFVQKTVEFIFYFYLNIKDKQIYKNENENNITLQIANFLKLDEKFEKSLLKVNIQAQNESKTNKGYYDLKFESSLWSKNKYFTIECKRLEDDNEKINEYVYVIKKDKNKNQKIDGGMYRFVQDDKYSPKLQFGAMLGYIQNGEPQNIINKIKDKILITPEINLIDKQQIYNSNVLNFPYTFQSKHSRINQIDIELMHLFFNFQ